MNLDAFPKATFAGGCFWCLEADMLHLPGLLSVTSGYTGGDVEKPSYDEVCQGDTGHFEAVEARFDPALVDYRALVDWFWRRMDPTNADGQFCDHGPQYRPAVFVHDADQEREARASKAALDDLRLLPRPNVTEILPAAPFYEAEGHHQEYSAKNPRRYTLYRMGCGRDATLAKLWGREAADPLFAYAPRLAKGAPPEAELRRLLPGGAYHIARAAGTEPPFTNAYHDERRPGLYVDPVSGAPLFASIHKFNSGTGWPSFTRPLMPGNVTTRTDRKLLMPRTEVLAWHSGNHLGHVFDDGPRHGVPGAAGQRYCMNSAALRFIPAPELAAAGYGLYAGLFA